MRAWMRMLCLALLVGLLPACSDHNGQTPPWLLGHWQLAFNPQQDDADELVFHADGQVTVETVRGRKLPGHFLIHEDQLLLVIQSGQRSIETQFRISVAKDQLIYKNGAYYMKAGDRQGGGAGHE